jgi:2-methylisocitrate lyase-like PEP mutase family enzyme
MAIIERRRLEWSAQGLARSPVWMLQSDDRPNRAALNSLHDKDGQRNCCHSALGHLTLPKGPTTWGTSVLLREFRVIGVSAESRLVGPKSYEKFRRNHGHATGGKHHMNRIEKVARFRALHLPGDPVIMPNPWDLGSAKVMANLGAKALATTSSGFGFTIGLGDGGQLDRDTALAHASALSTAVDVPLNGDFENGFGDGPETVAETVRLAAEVGLSGVSIEDIALPTDEAYPFDLAIARIEAAVEAARAADIVLTARADGWYRRSYDQSEALRRCTAFADVGAEVIYAPVVDAQTTRAMATLGPWVNILAAGAMRDLSVAEIGTLGAARISIGGGLARVTHQTIIDGTRAMLEEGNFTILKGADNAAEVEAMLAD